jgi:hypothetical protein
MAESKEYRGRMTGGIGRRKFEMRTIRIGLVLYHWEVEHEEMVLLRYR